MSVASSFLFHHLQICSSKQVQFLVLTGSILVSIWKSNLAGVGEVFPGAEHRECMHHLVSNFKKRYHGKVLDDHLWAAA